MKPHEHQDEGRALAEYLGSEPTDSPAVNGSDAPSASATCPAEECVIGALLLGGPWSEVTHIIRIGDYSAQHQLILGAIAALAAEGRSHDVITVNAHLESTGHSLAAGGLAHLSQLARETPFAVNVGDYARAVRDKSDCRRLRQLLKGTDDADLLSAAHRVLSQRASLEVPSVPRTLPGIDFADMQAHLSDSYLIKGFLGANGLAAIIGPTGSGKTFFATELATHIAAGGTWRGHVIRGGLVIYAALEGPVSAENRFVAARIGRSFPAALPLRLTSGPINLRDPADVALLIAFVGEAESTYGRKCAAIFVDTLSRAMAGGDENGPEDMGALIAGADAVRLATGVTVILVHHLGKDESRGARGHSSLKAALDTEIEVASKDGGLHIATVIKQRDLPGGARFGFRLHVVELGRDDDGDPVTSCVIEHAEDLPTERRQPSGKNQSVLLTALQEWKRQHPDTDIVTSMELRAIGKAQSLPRQRLQEAVEGLEKFGWLAQCAGGVKFLPEASA